jgi:hypothetical protein
MSVKIQFRFGSAEETAKILGVSRTRGQSLVRLLDSDRDLAQRIGFKRNSVKEIGRSAGRRVYYSSSGPEPKAAAAKRRSGKNGGNASAPRKRRTRAKGSKRAR